MTKIMLRNDFSRGWYPSADNTKAPKNCLLRADNCVLDELGVLAVRRGSDRINDTALTDLDVHSLYTHVIDGVRYRMTGAGDRVYANSVSIDSGIAAGPFTIAESYSWKDVHFGSQLGWIFYGRGTTRKAYNGTTLRNWGIAKPTLPPTLTALAPDYVVLSSCDSGETNPMAQTEGTAAFVTGQDSTATGACQITADGTTLRGVITRTLTAETDMTAYVGGGTGTDDDLLDFYLLVTEPYNVSAVTIMIDVNGDSTNLFQDDYYTYKWSANVVEEVLQTPDDYTGTGYWNDGNYFPSPGTPADVSQPVSMFRVDAPIANAGWNHWTIARGKLDRVGSTPGKNWSTVKAIRFIVEGVTGNDPPVVAFDAVQLLGGDNRPCTGKYKWRYAFVRNCGDYFAISEVSDESEVLELKAGAATVTIPAASITAMDTEVDQIWVYRMGGYMDKFYRTQIITDLTGTVDVDDEESDRDAMIGNMPLDADITRPPADILGIAGPYYDRLFLLTQNSIYPSVRRNPDSYRTGQVLAINGEGEMNLWIRQTLAGLLVGTTNDIYRIEGTGDEYPDGTVDWRISPLNIASPPISEAVATDGNDLVYLAIDGWRLLQGYSSVPLRGDTDLLWRGYIRHEVDPVQIASIPTPRFRAVISGGVLTAMAMEGSDKEASIRLWKYNFTQQRWYRHIYPWSITVLYSEPDGTTLAGDNAGYTYILDVGELGQAVNQDNGADIPVEIWTIRDDDETPLNRKDLQSVGFRMDTYLNYLNVEVWPDSDDEKAWEFSTRMWGGGTVHRPFPQEGLDLDPCTTVQLRMTGRFSTFKLHQWWIEYLALPTQVVGQMPYVMVNKGDEGAVSGFKFRLNTLGKEILFYPYLDRESDAPFNVATGIKHPEDYIHMFTYPRRCQEATFSTDCPIELYNWEPLLMYPLPGRRQVWDSGELDLWKRYGRLRKVLIKCEAREDLDVLCYFDDVEKPVLKVVVVPDETKIYEVKAGREYHGTVNRVVVSSDGDFQPYWMDLLFAPVDDVTEKLHKIRIAP